MNVGVTVEVTSIFIVAVVPHPDEGVNVYVDVPVTDVLIVKGFHVPVILLFDVVGSAGGVEL